MVLDAKRSVKAKFPNKMETWIVGIAYPTFLLTDYPRLSVVTLPQRWGCRQPTESPGEFLLLPEQIRGPVSLIHVFNLIQKLKQMIVQAVLKSRDGLGNGIYIAANEETKMKMRLRIR